MGIRLHVRLRERGVCLIGSVLLTIPEFFTDMAGLALLALIALKACRERDGATGAVAAPK